MPAEGIGIYPYEETAGNEVSSTYEGRHITVREGELIHPFHADDLVNKGDPVIVCLYSATHNHATYGRAVGIALASATAVTDYIAVDTEGIWMGQVYADDDNGTQDIEAGDALFISDDSTGTDASIAADGTGDAAISKIRDNVLQVPFGYALGRADAGNAGTMAVKVHWDPRSHLLLDNEKLYFGDGVAAVPDVSLEWTGAALEMLPLGDNIDFLIGDGTNSFDVQIFGMSANDYMLWDSAVGRLDVINTAVGPDARMIQFHSTVAAPAMTDGEGVINKMLTVTGPATLHIFAESSWINLGAASECPENMMVRCDGMWDGGVTFPAAQSFVAYEKYTLSLSADPHWNSLWNLNFNGANTEIDCIFTCNDPGLCLGYAVGGAAQAAGIGSVPLFSTSDGQLRYVYVHAIP